VLGALLDAYQMVAGDVRLKAAAATEVEDNARTLLFAKRDAKARGIELDPAFEANLPTPASTLLASIPRTEVLRSQALFISIVGLLVSIFFIDRSDSLITFLVCALIAGSLTRYEHQRADITWLPVAFWVYMGAFSALVVVYTAIQVFVLG